MSSPVGARGVVPHWALDTYSNSKASGGGAGGASSTGTMVAGWDGGRQVPQKV